DDVSFSMRTGTPLGIVGESGCGKTLTSLSILRLIQNPGKIIGGQILFEGKDLMKLSQEEMRKIRGRDMTMIFQEPMSSLNPVFTVGEQIESVIRLHHKALSPAEIKAKAVHTLKLVNFPLAEEKYHQYPHQLSGGLQQRVLIGMAISCNPKLLIADEPTTALDVTIQAQILDLMKNLKQELQLSLILITHDLGVISKMCDEVLVMYAGRIVESGRTSDIFRNPRHPYTRGLLDSMQFKAIPGSVPSLTQLPSGCRFSDRCKLRQEICTKKEPELSVFSTDQKAACHFPMKDGDSL
ncbi:MAG: ABC transporter ATP-binding protein, partial [Pseudobdellovibrionaceae bacterium]